MGKKGFLRWFLTLFLVVSLTVAGTNVNAAQNLELKKCTLNMEKSQSSVKMVVTITGSQKTEKVSATMKLYVKEDGSYKSIKTWKNLSSSGQKLYVTKSFSSKGTEYKLIVNGTLSDGKNTDTFKKSIVKKIQ